MEDNLTERIDGGPILSIGFINAGDPDWPDLEHPAISLSICFSEGSNDHEYDSLLEPTDIPTYFMISLQDCVVYYRVVVWFIVKPIALGADDEPVFFYRFYIDITEPNIIKQINEYLQGGADILLGTGFWRGTQQVATRWYQVVEHVYSSEEDMKPLLQEMLEVDDMSELDVSVSAD